MINKASGVILFAFLLGNVCSAQTNVYEPLGGGTTGWAASTIVYDSVESKIFVNTSIVQNGDVLADFIAQYGGQNWDTVHGISNRDQVFRFKKVNNKIYAFGYDLWAKDDFGNWTMITQTGSYGAITDLCWFNNELIIIGGFDTLNGQPMTCFAKYDGVSITPFAQNETWALAGRHFHASCVFNNELYIGGFFANATGTLQYLMKYDGVDGWTQVGPVLNGFGAKYLELTVYKGKMYLGGYFKMDDGNIGNHLIRYDGVNFDNMNGGFDNTAGFYDMEVKDSLLFIVGPKALSSGQEFGGFVTFNGNSFCLYDTLGMSTGLPEVFTRLTFMNDTLIVGGGLKAFNGDTIRKIGKYTGDFTPFECVNVMSVDLPLHEENLIKIYPNPFSGILTIDGNEIIQSIKIFDLTGKLICETKPDSPQTILDLYISNGIYIIEISVGEKKYKSKISKF